jgi:DNA-binding GntR family transcriptional regulator
MSVGNKGRAEKSIEEHRAILEAIKNKDKDLAEKLANDHIMNVMISLNINE